MSYNRYLLSGYNYIDFILMDSINETDIQNTLDMVFDNMSNVSFEQFVAELERKSERLESTYSRKGSAKQYNQGAPDYYSERDDDPSSLERRFMERHLLQVYPHLQADY